MAVLEGKVWRYGDNIDTDVIIPARYLNTFDPKELSKHCMVDIDPTFAENVKAGDIMVGGKNFGCGTSSRDSIPAILSSRAAISAAAPRANMRLSPSKQAVYPSSLHRLSPAFSTETASM